MERDVHTYEGEDIEVSYDVARCIHARECVEGLPAVFDPDRRPWIDPDAADADEVAEVVTACPTGALQFERSDGGPAEPTPEENVVTVVPGGPLHLRGDIELVDDGETLLSDTRVALCRCGATGNAPLCDGSHEESEFAADGSLATEFDEVESPDGTLRVRLRDDGPLILDGNFEVRSADGEQVARSDETALCRCGGSGTKPFCDGTHRDLGFSTEE